MILRAMFAIALLLGGGGGDRTQAATRLGAHESCCCGTPVGVADSCPCPKPEGNRGASRSSCGSSTAVTASLPARRTQGQRRIEPRPEPTHWARGTAHANGNLNPGFVVLGGRDPDLNRHLAHLSTFRI